LTERERDLLWWVLPADRPGYAEVRSRIASMTVVAAGRRGEGDLVLAPSGHPADLDGPLSSVIAFGAFAGDRGRGSVTVREEVGGQIDVEIVDPGQSPGEVRWTYSGWQPGQPCPQCADRPREVTMSTRSGSPVTLAICARDRRIWVHIAGNGMCRPIPVTLFYSELMRRTGIRDPKVALRADRLFEAPGSFSDEDLTVAFVSYNHVRAKLADDDPLIPPTPRRSFLRRWLPFIR
jgi:hypothetical protein